MVRRTSAARSCLATVLGCNAVLIVLAGALTGACGSDSSPAASGNNVTCGPGTRLSGTECVLAEDGGAGGAGGTAGSGGQTDGGITCGPGTVQQGSQCVAAAAGAAGAPDASDITCGPGTVLVNGQCVPDGDASVSGEAPVIEAFSASKLHGDAPLTTTFNWSIHSPAGLALSCELDADGDGRMDQAIPNCTSNSIAAYTFTNPGGFDARLVVRDSQSRTAASATKIFSNKVQLAPGV